MLQLKSKMHCNQLQLPLQQQQQQRRSVGQENATLVANQCVVTMQLNVNQKSDYLSDYVCCAGLKQIVRLCNCDLLYQRVYFVD